MSGLLASYRDVADVHDTGDVSSAELPASPVEQNWAFGYLHTQWHAYTPELCFLRRGHKPDEGYKKIMLNKKLKPTGPKNK